MERRGSSKVGKVIGFLLLKPAFSKQNISSIGLVAIFFAIYVIFGGTVSTTLPELKTSNGVFGGVDSIDSPGEAPVAPVAATQTASAPEGSQVQPSVTPDLALGAPEQQQLQAPPALILPSAPESENNPAVAGYNPNLQVGNSAAAEVKQLPVQTGSASEAAPGSDDLADLAARLKRPAQQQ